MTGTSFDVLTTTAVELQHVLNAGRISSVEIVQHYLAQIDRHEAKLNAFIDLAPRHLVFSSAAALDAERLNGKRRGPLHGIPIVVKDCFITPPELGMGTTAGSWALAGAQPKECSPLVQHLIDQGLIILGKTNMTEFCGMKMTMMSPGWSAYGGQTLSPYVGDIEKDETILGHSSPGGSSTGSAVAVAAGFSPLALGTETIGSIITPATRAGLYALKPTVGLQDTRGMYRMTEFFDCPGPMAKTPEDLAVLASVMLRQPSLSSPTSAEESALRQPWEGLSVGYLDPRVWKLDEAMCRQHEGTAEQMVEEYEGIIAKLKQEGCSVTPVELPDPSTLTTVDGEQAIMPIAFWDFKNIGIPQFLSCFEDHPVRSLTDVIDYNDKHKDRALPYPHTEQNDLIKALANTDKEDHIRNLKSSLRSLACKNLDAILDAHNINVIIAPADSALPIYTAASGYPVAAAPLGQLRYNRRPFGLCLLARQNQEQTLLRFMSAYQDVVQHSGHFPPLPQFPLHLPSLA